MHWLKLINILIKFSNDLIIWRLKLFKIMIKVQVLYHRKHNLSITNTSQLNLIEKNQQDATV